MQPLYYKHSILLFAVAIVVVACVQRKTYEEYPKTLLPAPQVIEYCYDGVVYLAFHEKNGVGQQNFWFGSVKIDQRSGQVVQCMLSDNRQEVIIIESPPKKVDRSTQVPSPIKEGVSSPSGGESGVDIPTEPLTQNPVEPRFCSQDAQICPDGVAVGRSGNNCTFDCSDHKLP